MILIGRCRHDPHLGLVAGMNLLDHLNDVGWIALCIGLYFLALFVAIALAKASARADQTAAWHYKHD